jgi:hypothetical protein
LAELGITHRAAYNTANALFFWGFTRLHANDYGAD